MFTAYWNSTIRESIRRQDEEDMVREILAVGELTEWNNAYVAFPVACLNPRFSVSHEKVVTEKALAVRRRELMPRPRPPQHVEEDIEEDVCCPAGPPPRSFLGGLFSDTMSDYYAYQHFNDVPGELPSTAYLRQKAVGSVLWDVLLGRRWAWRG